jgi:hypothetical protein
VASPRLFASTHPASSVGTTGSASVLSGAQETENTDVARASTRQCETRPCPAPNSSPSGSAKSCSCSLTVTPIGKSRTGCASPSAQLNGTAPASGASSILLPARLSSRSRSRTTSPSQRRQSSDRVPVTPAPHPRPNGGDIALASTQLVRGSGPSLCCKGGSEPDIRARVCS